MKQINKDRTKGEAALRSLLRKSEKEKRRLARRVLRNMVKTKKLYPVPVIKMNEGLNE